MNDTDAYKNAKRYVERKVGFYIHLAIYVVVNTGLIAVNLSVGSGVPWALGPLLGWGIGIFFHGLAVFLHAPGSSWKQRMIEKEMRRNTPQ
jgi:hypothetical protein